MKGYLYAWVCVALLSAVAEWILPLGNPNGTPRYVHFIIGLCLTVALLPLVREGMERIGSLYADMEQEGDWENQSSSDAYFQEYVSGVTAECCQGWVREALSTHFHIADSLFEVAIEVSVGEENLPQITEVQICLYGKEIFQNPHEIEAYFEKALSVPCRVSVGI